MAAARFLIYGRVQGVFFRASTRDQARRLAVVGHARNLADGRVEVLAWGTESALDQLEQWLQAGPVHARVDAVSRERVDDGPAPSGFTVV